MAATLEGAPILLISGAVAEETSHPFLGLAAKDTMLKSRRPCQTETITATKISIRREK